MSTAYDRARKWADTTNDRWATTLATEHVRGLLAEVEELRADLEWLVGISDDGDTLVRNSVGKHYWERDISDAEYDTIREAIAAKRAEVKP